MSPTRKTQNKGGGNDPAAEEKADSTQRDLSRGGDKVYHDELGHELPLTDRRKGERERGSGPGQSGTDQRNKP